MISVILSWIVGLCGWAMYHRGRQFTGNFTIALAMGLLSMLALTKDHKTLPVPVVAGVATAALPIEDDTAVYTSSASDVFHRPNCPLRGTPLKFDTWIEARSQGKHPCPHCFEDQLIAYPGLK